MEKNVKKKNSKLTWLIFLLMIALLVGILFNFDRLMYFSMDQSQKKECISNVKSALDSPSSFKLKKYHAVGVIPVTPPGGMTSYPAVVEFDAENAFGVAIRHRAACMSNQIYLLNADGEVTGKIED